MSKVNLLTLKRPERKAETRTFSDPEQPGVEVTLTLRPLDTYGVSLALEAAGQMVEAYAADGFPLPGEPGQEGEAPRITPAIAQPLCMLEAMQAGPETERYSRTELVGLLINMPTAYGDVVLWANELNEKLAGNPPRAAGAPSTAPPSTTTSPTPNGCSTLPPPSGLSMSDFEVPATAEEPIVRVG